MHTHIKGEKCQFTLYVLCTIHALCLQVAYVIFKKRAGYAAIKGVNSLRMEFLSNPTTGGALV